MREFSFKSAGTARTTGVGGGVGGRIDIGVGVGIGIEGNEMSIDDEGLGIYRAALEHVGWAYRFAIIEQLPQCTAVGIDPDTDSDPIGTRG
jgi:hypothetical protein